MKKYYVKPSVEVLELRTESFMEFTRFNVSDDGGNIGIPVVKEDGDLTNDDDPENLFSNESNQSLWD